MNVQLWGEALVALALICGVPLAWWLIVVYASDQIRWLRSQRGERKGVYCASLFCMERATHTVVSSERTLTRRMCWRHAVYARAQMVLDGDTGTEVLDTMLDRHAEREALAARRRRLADRIEPRDLPTWDREQRNG